MKTASQDLRDVVALTALKAPAPSLAMAARHVAGLHAPDVVAVLAYGSTLRGEPTADTLIDLYVLTGSFEGVSANRLSRFACRLVPPNVAYAETMHDGVKMRIKYAVLPIDLFVRAVAPATANPYFWARFAQPCRIVHAASPAVQSQVLDALAMAATTFIAAARPLALSDPENVLDIWREGFRATYRTELRPESEHRGDQIVESDPGYYASAGRAALDVLGQPPSVTGPGWASRRRRGRILSILRLMKAAFTFTAGADYLAWKISRHSGVEVRLKPWQRRHPIVAAVILLPALMRKGAVR